MSNFRLDQKVVCIDADGAPQLKLRATYTISGFGLCQSWYWRGDVIETSPLFLHEVSYWESGNGFCPERFRPAVERKHDASIEVLRKLLVTDKEPVNVA